MPSTFALKSSSKPAHVLPSVQAEVRDAWRSGANLSLLDRLAQSLAKADDRVAGLTAFCSGSSQLGQNLPEFAWLADSETPVLIRNNMRVYLARWLVQQGYYDEAISWTEGLETDDVAAPRYYYSTAPSPTISLFNRTKQISHSPN